MHARAEGCRGFRQLLQDGEIKPPALVFVQSKDFRLVPIVSGFVSQGQLEAEVGRQPLEALGLDLACSRHSVNAAGACKRTVW